MRLAVIDCGTNTFNLIITEVKSRKAHSKIFNTRIPVKLGEGTINEGFIAPDPFERGLEAVGILTGYLREHGVEHVLAFATSAIRDAANGQEFVAMVKARFNIELEVIDGIREAELIYFGIREAVALKEELSLIMDIGGGSTEFILAGAKGIVWKQSFRLGAARLLERFAPSDPITQKEIENLQAYLSEQLQPLFDVTAQHMPVELVGSSGAFDSLVEMIHGELGGESLMDFKTEYEIDLKCYFEISALVTRSTLQQRRQIKGLVPMRVDMIVISCLMVDFILKNLHLSRMRVSTYSLKEGALAEFISRQFKDTIN